MSKKELAKRESTEVAETTLDAWGDDVHVSSQDILISKILPMQGLSKLVADRKAQIGEYRDSVTGELLGSIDKPMAFVPVHVEKFWIVSKEINGKMEYQTMEPMTRENEGRKWEVHIDGVKHRNDYNYRYYVLRPEDIKDGNPIPYILQFRRASVKGGKKLFTQMFIRNKQVGKIPAAYVMNLEGKMTTNDFGTFVTIDVAVNREATKDEMVAAFEIKKAISAGTTNKVDDSDIKTDTGVTTKLEDYPKTDREF